MNGGQHDVLRARACSAGLCAEGRIEADVAIAAHQVVIDNCGWPIEATGNTRATTQRGTSCDSMSRSTADRSRANGGLVPWPPIRPARRL
jgi:hypothetical protein